MKRKCGRGHSKVKRLLLQCCTLHKFHVMEGPNVHDQIAFYTFFILRGGPSEWWLYSQCALMPNSNVEIRLPAINHCYFLFIVNRYTVYKQS